MNASPKPRSPRQNRRRSKAPGRWIESRRGSPPRYTQGETASVQIDHGRDAALPGVDQAPRRHGMTGARQIEAMDADCDGISADLLDRGSGFGGTGTPPIQILNACQ